MLLRKNKKGEWTYILKVNLKNKRHIRTISKIIKIIVVSFIAIIAFILLKYKPAYKVTLNGEIVGYITNKEQFEQLIQNEILNSNEINVAFVDIAEMPSYDFLFIENTKQTSENQIFAILQEAAIKTYKIYAITINNEETTYVNSKEEAEEIITKIKEENTEEEIQIGMQEIYTQNIEESQQAIELAKATTIAEEQLAVKVEEQQKIKEATFEGVYFSVRPVTGTITSRFGASESIRSHAHSGLDIAAPSGTPIKVAANGTVSFAGTMGGYGNLVIVDHANGVQTYYGHCSKIYASVGDEVTAGDIIAAVGTTGFSTGNHLHFEIRKDGKTINPQKYLYK